MTRWIHEPLADRYAIPGFRVTATEIERISRKINFDHPDQKITCRPHSRVHLKALVLL